MDVWEFVKTFQNLGEKGLKGYLASTISTKLAGKAGINGELVEVTEFPLGFHF